jgi:hypothetical protein
MFLYILSWKFDKEGNAIPMPIADQQSRNGMQITIKDNSNNNIPIAQKEVNQSHKTLGVHKAIDDNEIEQISQLKTKSDNYGRKGTKSINNA